jgi:hypothetical protein
VCISSCMRCVLIASSGHHSWLHFPSNRGGPKSQITKTALVLTGMFRFKPARQFVGRCHSVVRCSLNMGISFRTVFVNQMTNKNIDGRVEKIA